MARLNRNGAKLMHKYQAHAATDVTGFGLLGARARGAHSGLASGYRPTPSRTSLCSVRARALPAPLRPVLGFALRGS